MTWRILVTALYAGVLGALMALENSSGIPDALLLGAWLAGLGVGFLVGRWWVLVALVGMLVGRAIGWDPGEHDGVPAFSPPHVLTMVVFAGLPLLLGVAISGIWERRRSREPARDRPSAAAD
ncbi:MAG TPA: hypothetical protein VFX85_08995 [Solirubrobacterales bacterium]|nr:hypothetical protein [Solirubrobacterales bacterium]